MTCFVAAWLATIGWLIVGLVVSTLAGRVVPEMASNGPGERLVDAIVWPILVVAALADLAYHRLTRARTP